MRRDAVPPPWTVESDPEGTFRGPFNRFDLVYTARLGNWPEGIRFRNRRTGAVAVYRNGCLYIGGNVVAQKAAISNEDGYCAAPHIPN